MINSNKINNLVYSAVFSLDINIKKSSRAQIRKLAKEKGIYPASINSLYLNQKPKNFTVPAINIRFMTYDTAQIIFALMKKYAIGPVIFEIARSEIKYTDQAPDEYVTVILASAIAQNYQGPVFIQGDHYQFSARRFSENAKKETSVIKDLIKESISAGFYNIDIDASTLVDLTKEDLNQQQKNNYEMTAVLTKYIREIEPAGVTVSVGGEIGHIGGVNSSVQDFVAFMKGYLANLQPTTYNLQPGISKVSVQTGTSHGGIPMKDGTVAKVNLDFEVLESIGKVAREKYHIGGPVQHGASTLPNELFGKFPESKTLEVHLATGFQNIMLEKLPKKIKEEIDKWLIANCFEEKKPDQTEEQFLYKIRKKSAGPFKEKLWKMSEEEKAPIIKALEEQFKFLFHKLGVVNTRKTLNNVKC